MAPEKTGEKKPRAKKPPKETEATSVEEVDPLRVFQSIEEATEGGKKRLSVERIYQKKTQLEHILLRPSTYIGSIDPHTENVWVYDAESDKLISKNITYVPGLYKIFDEIVVNAADNKQRDPKMSTIKININAEKNEISVWNNGRGIPVVEHQNEKMYVPELIFGTLLTSSNYDDNDARLTGGLNGFGAKLCNIFSKKFTVETSSKEYGKSFKQTWRDNMGATDKPIISNSKDDDFTCVTFTPDLARFGMERLEDDIIALMSRRAYDLAGSTRGVSVFLNGKKLPIKGFKQYVEQYTNGRTDDNGEPLKVVFDNPNERWEIALTASVSGTFQQVSFVNSIATMKGGRHVDYVADQIVEKLIEHVKKQIKKTGMNIRPLQVKNHLWLFVNSLIVNPTFDSQTKDTMTLQANKFGSKCELSEKFINQAVKCGVVENILDWLKGKAQQQLQKQCHSTKHSKLKGIAKLDDANDAGTKNSLSCTLILTEGDSAKTLAVAGLGVVGRDRYGVFPLKGKVLNVREASHKQIMENVEINALIKILGLQYKKKYDTEEDLKTLRYGKVMIMTDQDQDGSHIKGLLINFIHHNWPSLLRHDFLEEFITPIVKASKGKEELSFYSMPEYEEWKASTADWNKWKIKYYKGLGTSTSKEAKEYFANMKRHQIKFKYGGDEDDRALDLAFSKKKTDERKDWLTGWMEERKTRRQEDLPDIYLYEKDTTAVTYSDFVNKELVLFSNMDNERSIPNLVDGLKPGQRKVMFTCFRRNDKREVKVAQLAGSVAEMSAYHHGEQSLMSTIINLAQNFVGSNNINLLLPIGQFGTRLQGGKDAASPRYIFTMLNPVTRAMFHPADDPCLTYTYDDNKKIEPEYYCPIIPTVLINGAEGIGTGWSTKVPLYNPRDLVENIKRMISGDDPLPMTPWYKNYRGTIQRLGPQRYLDSGEISILNDETIEITELPHDTATQAYKENVLEPMLNGSEKQPAVIQDYREYHTDRTVRFVVKMAADKLQQFRAEGLHKAFKLQSTITLTSMVLFGASGCLRKYENVEDILKEFYDVRLKMYEKRQVYLIGLLQAEADRLSNQARFILEKVDGKIVLEKKKKRQIVEQLVARNFDPDPVMKWKEEQQKKENQEEEEQQETEDDSAQEDEPDEKRLKYFNYLVTMQLIKLSEEEVAKLLRERDLKQEELNTLRSKTPKDLWQEDLAAFMVALDKQEAKEKDEEASDQGQASEGGGAGGGAPKKRKKAAVQRTETKPSAIGERVVPVVDAATREKYEKVDKAKENRATGVTKRGPKRKSDDLENSGLAKRVKKRLSGEAKPVSDDKSIKRFFATDKSKAQKNGDAATAPKKSKKKAKDSSDDDEDDDIVMLSDSDGSFEPTPPPQKSKKQSSDGEDDEGEKKTKKPTAKASLRARPKIDYRQEGDDDDESDDEVQLDDDSGSNYNISDYDDDDDSQVEKAKKRGGGAGKKAAAAGKGQKAGKGDDEFGAGEGKAKKKKDGEAAAAPRVENPARGSRKKVIYNIDDDSDVD